MDGELVGFAEDGMLGTTKDEAVFKSVFKSSSVGPGVIFHWLQSSIHSVWCSLLVLLVLRVLGLVCGAAVGAGAGAGK
jgi:hypothetical protein